MDFALALTECEQMALYIEFGEQKGGEWDADSMSWAEPPKPTPVFAVAAEMRGQH